MQALTQYSLNGEMNYIIARGETFKEKAILLLHGFPAEGSSSKYEKNIDIALELSQALGCDVYVPHYRGLGISSTSDFSFKTSIYDSLALLNEISDSYCSISIFGHSWGGYIAFNLLREFQGKDIISHVCLFSPFSKIQNREGMGSLLSYVVEDTPYVLKRDLDFYLKEFEELKVDNNPLAFSKGILDGIKVAIYQAAIDEEVLEKDTRELCEHYGLLNHLEIVESDHSIDTNRDVIKQKIVEFFKC